MQVLSSEQSERLGLLIRRILEDRRQALTAVSPWGDVLTDDLLSLVTGGKMIRGQLVLFFHQALDGKEAESAETVAAAMELFQTALLIHDDIMDRDRLRRGVQTLHERYKVRADSRQISDAVHFGSSMAICAGDSLMHTAYSVLSTISAPATLKRAITDTIGRELAMVCVGQMQDVAMGLSKAIPGEEEILACYRYKTGRYSLALPMVTGAMLAGAEAAVTDALWSFGEHAGILFQLTDDELGVFGTGSETGKPVGSDLREGKKTLYYRLLWERLPPEERPQVFRLFAEDMTDEDVAFLTRQIRELGIEQDLRQRIETLSEELRESSETLPVSGKYRPAIRDFIGMIAGRRR